MKFNGKSIVLDLDGVIADIDKSVSEYASKEIDTVNFNYSSWFTTDTKDQTALNLFSNKFFWRNMMPFEDAWYQCNYWFSLGIDIEIVTARRCPAAMEETTPWLERWNINTNVPKFSKFGEKVNIIKDIEPMFVVEDNPHEILILEKSGIKCFLRKSWYNKDYWNDLESIDNLLDIDIEKL